MFILLLLSNDVFVSSNIPEIKQQFLSSNIVDSVRTNDVAVDEQLYSRQIFVYGKSAQQALATSNLVILGSNGPLIAEIVKNMALAGVGRIIILNDDNDTNQSNPDNGLLGGQSLVKYARSLNPFVSVSY